ncbi:hypothetical protein [Streptomyces sp. NPDC046978]|uniref:hypothetical protein n=1 Tax=Streptomyces sp. NPDC046978 TaxID=3154704 RepID=UPI0033D644A6
MSPIDAPTLRVPKFNQSIDCRRLVIEILLQISQTIEPGRLVMQALFDNLAEIYIRTPVTPGLCIAALRKVAVCAMSGEISNCTKDSFFHCSRRFPIGYLTRLDQNTTLSHVRSDSITPYLRVGDAHLIGTKPRKMNFVNDVHRVRVCQFGTGQARRYTLAKRSNRHHSWCTTFWVSTVSGKSIT